MKNTESNCGACSSAEVQALFLELLDPSTSAERAHSIREHIAQCAMCYERLEREEIIRALVSKSCKTVKAPQELRSRISISFTRITF